MTAGIGHWARSRLAEHRAIAEYRNAWRRLRRIHDAPDQRGSAPEGGAQGLNANLHMTTSPQAQEEKQ